MQPLWESINFADKNGTDFALSYHRGVYHRGYVKSVFIIHVGGTRCVTSRTDNIMKIRARITLTVEVIRTCIFLCLFDV